MTVLKNTPNYSRSKESPRKGVFLCALRKALSYGVLSCSAMIHDEDRATLIKAIATREGTARELAKWYGCTIEELRQFTLDNKEVIESYHAMGRAKALEESAFPDPQQLDDLWISKKFERIRRLQETADLLYSEIESGARDATTLREFRAYLASVANELGQLLHRGSGESADGDVLDVRIEGIDMETLK